MSKMKVTTRADGAPERDNALMEAKLTLVSARERGEPDALAQALREHPAYSDALMEFDLALMATSGYADEANAPDVLEVAQKARTQAFAAVFGAQPGEVAQAPLSLKALRMARNQRLSSLAERLGLGVDVLSALEAGRIRVASVPQRLRESLAEMLSATVEQIGAALTLDVAPALRRGQPGATSHDAKTPRLDFSEAVMLSKSMTQEQRVRWLTESAQP